MKFRDHHQPAIACLRHTPGSAKERAGLEGSHIDHAIRACWQLSDWTRSRTKLPSPKKTCTTTGLYTHMYMLLYIYICVCDIM